MSSPNRALSQLAGMMHLTGHVDHADRIHRRLETKSMESLASAKQNRGLDALVSLAEVHAARGNYSEAVRLYRRVLRADEEKFGVESPSLIPRLHALASVLDAAGDPHEALCVRERISVLTANAELV